MGLRLFLDTNILLDLAAANRCGHEAALRLFDLAVEAEGVEFVACAMSLKDFFYVYGRHYSADVEDAWEATECLTELVTFAYPTESAVRRAFERPEPDFEDSLVLACAEEAGADAIVSRDARVFLGSRLEKLSPMEAAARVTALA